MQPAALNSNFGVYAGCNTPALSGLGCSVDGAWQQVGASIVDQRIPKYTSCGSRWVPIKSNPCRVFFWRGSLIHISRYSFTHFPAHADRARAPALTPASPSLVIPRSTQNHHNAAAASFGVLVHEVLTQRVPFAGKSVAKVITAVVAKGHRPGYLEGEEAGCNPALVKLADVCWTQDPAVRFVCVCVCVCVYVSRHRSTPLVFVVAVVAVGWGHANQGSCFVVVGNSSCTRYALCLWHQWRGVEM